MVTIANNTDPAVKPLLREIDVFGLTHPGRVREVNADHFIVASFHRAINVHASSLDWSGAPTLSGDSRGFLFLVADGVGSLAAGHEGSAQVVETLAQQLLEMSEVSLQRDPQHEQEVIERLRRSVADTHHRLCEFAECEGRQAATTMTLLMMIWPRSFLFHAGDSRCYRLRDGTLEQLTVDQTMAQVMIDSGAMSPEAARNSRLSSLLLSAMGSPELDVQVSTGDLRRGDRTLLCTDGLTRYVTDAELADVLRSDRRAEQVCRELVDLALERGGADNITVVVGGMAPAPA